MVINILLLGGSEKYMLFHTHTQNLINTPKTVISFIVASRMGRKRFEALSTTGSELLFPTRVRWYSFIRQVMELPLGASWIVTMAVNRTDGGAPLKE